MPKDNRRRKIIIAALAVLVGAVLVILLACSGSGAGVNGPGNAEAAEQEQSTSGAMKKKSEREPEQETVPAKAEEMQNVLSSRPEAPEGSVNADARGTGNSQPVTEQRQTPSAGSPEIPVSYAEPETQQPAVHVHAYALSSTRSINHPAVTEQVWVTDSAAWDEVIRSGYHVSVVTCHECGAQFSDTSQAAALEAWGNHIDAAHDGDGGYDMASSYDVPAEILHHDATGHYETRTVSAAWTEVVETYSCSCGDSYTKSR